MRLNPIKDGDLAIPIKALLYLPGAGRAAAPVFSKITQTSSARRTLSRSAWNA